MKILTTFFLIIVSLSCSTSRSQSDFNGFRNKFNEIGFPFHINDSLAFDNWNFDDLIPIDEVKNYNLITKYANKEYPLEIQDYKCTRVGKYKMDKYIVLLYKTYTTEAGRGNPIIILSTFTLEGVKKDEVIVLWDDAEDPLYSQKVMLSIPNNTKFEVKSTVRNNGILNGEIVPKKVTERMINYEINRDGIIERKEDTEKNVFVDTNPEILDDFPY
jgi:hypothetical protein